MYQCTYTNKTDIKIEWVILYYSFWESHAKLSTLQNDLIGNRPHSVVPVLMLRVSPR